MVAVRTFESRVWRSLPLLACSIGCVPDLSALDEGEQASGDKLITTPQAGAGGSAGALGMLAGSGGGGASSVAGSPMGGAGNGGVSSAGAGGQMQTCTPQGAEVCDGEDNDCNGVVDNGCPSGVSTVFHQELAALGDSTGGAQFVDDCVDGAVLVGIHLAMDGWLGQVKGICRRLQLELSASADSGYVVKLVDDAELLPHPETSTYPVTESMCSENETLVALRISQQYATLEDGTPTAVIPQVTIGCAKLTLTKQGDSYTVDWEGRRDMAPVTGTYADGTAWFAEAVVPGGSFATRLGGASGAWIDRLALGVSNVVIATAP